MHEYVDAANEKRLRINEIGATIRRLEMERATVLREMERLERLGLAAADEFELLYSAVVVVEEEQE